MRFGSGGCGAEWCSKKIRWRLCLSLRSEAYIVDISTFALPVEFRLSLRHQEVSVRSCLDTGVSDVVYLGQVRAYPLKESSSPNHAGRSIFCAS